MFYLALRGDTLLLDGITRFLLPTLAGNIFGGSVLYALLSYAQVHEELGEMDDGDQLRQSPTRPRDEGDVMPVTRIVSGGQTGVDRAALDRATAHAIPYGGWCPKDGWAEDLCEPPGLLAPYPGLTPTPESRPEQRTAWNVRDSDATLILLAGPGIACSPGTIYTQDQARHFCKPALILELGRYESLDEARSWLDDFQANLTLNVAGPRESQSPGIYEATLLFLDELIATCDAFTLVRKPRPLP